MARYIPRKLQEGAGNLKMRRAQRKYRGHKLMVAMVKRHKERHAGWGYAKRRAALAGS